MPTTIIMGTSAAETLYGTDTRDPSVAYDEVFLGNGGADIIYAGGGNDWVWALAGDPSNVTFFGQDGDDVLVSFEGNDVLYGDYPDPNIDTGMDALGGGNDVLISGAGNDFLYGGSGNDSLWGGDGNDFVYGGLGADVVVGEAGDDWLYGGYNNSSDRDVVIGGTGNDHLYLSGGPATGAWGGDGDDYIVGGKTQVGGPGNDFIASGQAFSQVMGGEGADTFAVLYAAEAITWDFEVGTD